MPFYGGDPIRTDAKFLMERLMRGGMSRAQAAAMVGNLQKESSLITNNMNTGEQAYGLMQWRGDRFQDLQKFANSQGKPWTDAGVQADFIGHELNTTEKKNAEPFRAATDVPTANAAARQIIRYRDKEEIPLRGSYAQQVFDETPQTDVAAPTANVSRGTLPYAETGVAPRGRGLRQGLAGGLGDLGSAYIKKNYPGGVFGVGAGQAPQKPTVAELGQAAAPSSPAVSAAQPPNQTGGLLGQTGGLLGQTGGLLDQLSNRPRDEDRFGSLVDPLRYGELGYGVG